MSLYVNSAAIDSWRELERAIDGPLHELMSKGGFNDEAVDAWVLEMLQNSVDDAGEAAVAAEQPKRIKRAA